MSEIYSETPYRLAREHHRDLLKKSQTAWMTRTAASQSPNIWDHVTLHLGNWLIKLGSGLKSHSAFSQLSKTHA